ncbi:hypothetical protein DENIS_4943 [Desulfonema ishimotonii]|uniref:Uncharacterized protein n=1 Tax=Desulfonema ishimotonii TaxID=45657 RepID=A0A401G423_9BACT|nr:hypothetical protein [Desulfonema ishimotonii]GBC63943.1 hypothetical protein DENIS_4943 [Desulfonema ishimotonii]
MTSYGLANPEMKRNIWLELTPNRLVVTPLVLGAIFFLAWLTADDYLEFMGYLRHISLMLFCLMVFVWGSKLVSESVVSEVNDRTWDFQRMTALGPADMTLGKLVGSAICPWYGAGFCAAAYILSALCLPDTVRHMKLLLVILFSGILCHALVLAMTLMGIRKNRGREKINSSFYLVIIIGLLFFSAPLISLFNKEEMLIRWYTGVFSPPDFMIFTSAFFLCWSVLGVYRAMRTELQIVNGPWVWTLFLVTLMLYASGLTANDDTLSFPDRLMLSLILSYGIGITLTYITAFSEPKDIVDFRRLADKVAKTQWREAGKLMPLWAISLILSVMLCAATTFFSLTLEIDTLPDEQQLTTPFYFNLLCFLLRDLGLLIYVNLKGRSDRADIAAMLYLMILYLLIPAIITVSGAESLLPVFVPTFDGGLLTGTLPVCIQLVFIIVLVQKRWAAGGLGVAGGPHGR